MFFMTCFLYKSTQKIKKIDFLPFRKFFSKFFRAKPHRNRPGKIGRNFFGPIFTIFLIFFEKSHFLKIFLRHRKIRFSSSEINFSDRFRPRKCPISTPYFLQIFSTLFFEKKFSIKKTYAKKKL